jgi:hypothetical protein
MESQTYRRELLLSDLYTDLIFEAEENLHELMRSAEQILNNLELALDILVFSQHQYTVSKSCNTLQLYDRTSIFKLSSDTGPEYPELRRCQKYTELRDVSQSIVETQRLELRYVKPRVVYIRKPTLRNSSGL